MFWEGRLGFKGKQNLLYGQGQAVRAHAAQPLGRKEPHVSNCQQCTVRWRPAHRGGEGTRTPHHPGPAAAAQEGPDYCRPVMRLALLTPQPFQVSAHVLWTVAFLPPHSGRWQYHQKTWALAGPSRVLDPLGARPFPVPMPAPDSPAGRTVLLLLYLNQGSADSQSQRVNQGSPLPLTATAVPSTRARSRSCVRSPLPTEAGSRGQGAQENMLNLISHHGDARHMRHPFFTPARMAGIRVSAGEEMKKLEPCMLAGGNIKLQPLRKTV